MSHRMMMQLLVMIKMPDLKPDILTVPFTASLTYVGNYFILHGMCIIQGYAIVMDKDGCWCTLCEPEQAAIALDEQKEIMQGDGS